MKNRERRMSEVPGFVVFGLLLLFAIQALHHHFLKSDTISSYQTLNSPRSADFYRSVSLYSDRLLSYLLSIGVQLHDNQKGQHINYQHLDYTVLSDWLVTLYQLNPDSDYPAFLASRVYAQVKDSPRVRLMIDVIERLFDKDPARHWRRMTEACLLAKHKLSDLHLALKLARKVAILPKSLNLPFWARDMELILLDELNELESARLLISSLLQSNEIKDPDEIRFLQFRLLKIQQALLRNEHSVED